MANRNLLGLRFVALAGAATLAFTAAHTRAQEPVECLSQDPADWPAPSRPYFMLAVDTSGSMTACTNPPTTYPQSCTGSSPLNSCGNSPTRYNDAKCAIESSVLAFAGQVNFGLATFAVELENCGSNCQSATCSSSNCGAEDYTCDASCTTAEFNTNNTCAGCGPRPGGASTRRGAIIRVPMLQDHFWVDPPEPSNVADLLAWTDGGCGVSAVGEELFAAGSTPLNGMLRDMGRYFRTSWSHPDSGITYTTPLSSNDLDGSGVNGSTGCRSVNVILITDGQETCDSQSDAVNAATDLYQNGATVGGRTFKIRTHVIGFAINSQTTINQLNAIASAGGTSSALSANNEVQLAQALS
ncbi:MAG: hypothetical protein R3B72_48665, partial [Polyangiaceae bacterium]